MWLIRWRWPLDSPLYQRSADTVRASRMSEVIKQKVLKPQVPHCWYLTRLNICSGGASVSNNGFNSVLFTLPSLVMYQKSPLTQDGRYFRTDFDLGRCLRTTFLPHEPIRCTTNVICRAYWCIYAYQQQWPPHAPPGAVGGTIWRLLLA